LFYSADFLCHTSFRGFSHEIPRLAILGARCFGVNGLGVLVCLIVA
jgi:hypothetical protein